MTAVWTTVGAGPAVIDVGTPLLFDVGVFLAVIGVVLDDRLHAGESR